MAALAGDNFNRANNASLGSNWTTVTGANAPQIVSNNVEPASVSATWSISFYNAITWPNDGYSQISIVTLNTNNSKIAGPIYRVSASAQTYYICKVLGPLGSSAANFQLFKVVAGSVTQLGTTQTTTVNSGDAVRIVCQGANISGLLRGVLTVGPVSDSAIASGNAGITVANAAGGSVASAVIGNFEGGSLLELPGWDGASLSSVYKYRSLVNDYVPSFVPAAAVVQAPQGWQPGEAHPTYMYPKVVGEFTPFSLPPLALVQPLDQFSYDAHPSYKNPRVANDAMVFSLPPLALVAPLGSFSLDAHPSYVFRKLGNDYVPVSLPPLAPVAPSGSFSYDAYPAYAFRKLSNDYAPVSLPPLAPVQPLDSFSYDARPKYVFMRVINDYIPASLPPLALVQPLDQFSYDAHPTYKNPRVSDVSQLLFPAAIPAVQVPQGWQPGEAHPAYKFQLVAFYWEPYKLPPLALVQPLDQFSYDAHPAYKFKFVADAGQLLSPVGVVAVVTPQGWQSYDAHPVYTLQRIVDAGQLLFQLAIVPYGWDTVQLRSVTRFQSIVDASQSLFLPVAPAPYGWDVAQQFKRVGVFAPTSQAELVAAPAAAVVPVPSGWESYDARSKYAFFKLTKDYDVLFSVSGVVPTVCVVMTEIKSVAAALLETSTLFAPLNEITVVATSMVVLKC